MNAVGLDAAGDWNQVFVNHGHKGDVVVSGEGAEKLLEGLDIVGPVVRRQRDARQQDFDVRGFERGEDLIEVAAGFFQGKAAQAVVAAEFDHDSVRVQGQNRGKIRERVLGGGAAGTPVKHLVVEGLGVKVVLKKVRVGLPFIEAVAGGNAVSVADQDAGIGRRKRPGEEKKHCD